jgi:Protein of unknown function (DUF1153)
MSRAMHVIGPKGSPLTIADSPAPGTKRWVIRRKAEVVAGIRGGSLSLEEACSRYTLTVDEFLSWQELIDQYGLGGFRATKIQRYTGSATFRCSAPCAGYCGDQVTPAAARWLNHAPEASGCEWRAAL